MLYREKKGQIPETMKVDKDVYDEDGKVCNTISWSKRSYFQRVTKSGLEKFIPNTLGGSQWMLDMDFFDTESDCMNG
jgi:hypothetical protein